MHQHGFPEHWNHFPALPQIPCVTLSKSFRATGSHTLTLLPQLDPAQIAALGRAGATYLLLSALTK